MKLFKSFEELINENNWIFDKIKDEFANYWAHIGRREPETLYDHIKLTLGYFMKLINYNNLEPLIDNIIRIVSFDNSYLGDLVKEMFLLSVIFHDTGKINPNFQNKKLGNEDFVVNESIKLGTDHSWLSALVFIDFFIKRITEFRFDVELYNTGLGFLLLFSLSIVKHHSSHIKCEYRIDEETIYSVEGLLKKWDPLSQIEILKNLLNNISSEKSEKFWKQFQNILDKRKFDYFALFVLLKLNYSLLTVADFYATTEYMTGLSYKSKRDFGFIDNNLRDRVLDSILNSTDYNHEILTFPDNILSYSLSKLNYKSQDNLNFLRKHLAANVLNNLKNYINERVFYIEAPTGAGKTNLSILVLREFLKAWEGINKVVYVFPFTTLVTQTYMVLKKTLGLRNSEIAEIHSKAALRQKGDLEEMDARYGKERKLLIDNLFVNYPFVLMTHISFFDIIKSNSKQKNYLLYSLANSVVIIDELQSYNPKHWDKIKLFISRYAELLNVRFILMSATLPKIDEISLPIQADSKVNMIDRKFIRLVNDPAFYYRNPNFSQRVSIEVELLDRKFEKGVGLKDLAKIVIEKSEKYAQNRKDEFKGSVFTIIEFIFKRSATEFYNVIGELKHFFDEIFVLSGTILEPRRRYIIDYLKDPLNRKKKKKILLITTQVVEAGVDIDMDLGFKNQSLIDSDEQLAGRINRNIKKQDSKLWLFRYDEPFVIYSKDLRYKATKQFSPEEIREILQKKDFDLLYRRVFEEIEKINSSKTKVDTLQDYWDEFRNLRFNEIDFNFRIIETDSASVFVPLKLSIYGYGDKPVFNDDEIDFLIKNDLLYDGIVDGEKVWYFYKNLVTNKDMKFVLKRYSLLQLNAIISRFTFSLFHKSIDSLKDYLDYEEEIHSYQIYGFYKIRQDAVDTIYSFESGLKTDVLEKSYEFL